MILICYENEKNKWINKASSNEDSTGLYRHVHSLVILNPARILYKSTAGRYRPVSYHDGPKMARCRFIKNAYWE